MRRLSLVPLGLGPLLAALLAPSAALAVPVCSADGPALSMPGGTTRALVFACAGTSETVTFDVVSEFAHAELGDVIYRPQSMELVVTPHPGFAGTDKLIFRGRDGTGWSDPVVVTIEVRPAAMNAAPACVPVRPAETASQGIWAELLLRCNDADGDAYRLEPSPPRFGTAVADRMVADSILGAIRSIRYLPNDGYAGLDAVVVRARDVRGAVSLPVSISVMVGSAAGSTAPAPPTTVADTEAAAERRTLSVRLGQLPRLRFALARGLRIGVRSSRAGSGRARVTLDGRTAKRLRLSRRGKAVTVATATVRLSAGGTQPLRLRFTERARRALARSRKVRLTIAVSADGGTRTKRTVTLRR